MERQEWKQVQHLLVKDHRWPEDVARVPPVWTNPFYLLMVRGDEEKSMRVKDVGEADQHLRKGWRIKAGAAPEEKPEGYLCTRHPKKRRLYFATWKAYMRHLRRTGETPQYKPPNEILKAASEYVFYCHLCTAGYDLERAAQKHINQRKRRYQRHPKTIDQIRTGKDRFMVQEAAERKKRDDVILMRIGAGATQAQLARDMGLSKSYVNNIVRRRRGDEMNSKEAVAV